MRRKPVPQQPLLLLVVAAVVMPIAVCVILALGRLLLAMGDDPAGAVVDWIALAFGAVWVLDLICLILALAVNSLSEPDEPPGPE